MVLHVHCLCPGARVSTTGMEAQLVMVMGSRRFQILDGAKANGTWTDLLAMSM